MSNKLTKNELHEDIVQTLDDFSEHQAEKATTTAYGHVMVGDGLSVTDGVISANIPDLEASNVSTTSGSNVQTEIDNLKSSVSNGKVQVRDTITGKGGTVADADGDGIPTFVELVTAINNVEVVPPKINPSNVSFPSSYNIQDVHSSGIYIRDASSVNCYRFDHNGTALKSYGNCVGACRNGFLIVAAGNTHLRNIDGTDLKIMNGFSASNFSVFDYSKDRLLKGDLLELYNTSGTLINRWTQYSQGFVGMITPQNEFLAVNSNNDPYFYNKINNAFILPSGAKQSRIHFGMFFGS